jgi:hypothetical protein
MDRAIAQRHLIAARSVVVHGAPLDVFALISSHTRLPEWVPGLLRVEVDESDAEVPGGAGAVRTLIPRFGRRGHERITLLDHSTLRIEYSATDDSLLGLCIDHRASITCRPDGRGTLVAFNVHARRGPSRLRWWLGRWMFRVAVAASLSKLAQRFASRSRAGR